MYLNIIDGNYVLFIISYNCHRIPGLNNLLINSMKFQIL